jgi:hypothetical protein
MRNLSLVGLAAFGSGLLSGLDGFDAER